MSLSQVESIRAGWAEGRRGENHRRPEFGSVCLPPSISHGWQALSPPGEQLVAFKMHVQNAMALYGSTAVGLGWGLERLVPEEEVPEREQQRRT